MNKRIPKTLTVAEKSYVSPNMLRIILTGKELDESLAWHPGSYVKLMIPHSSEAGDKPKIRTYTARSFDPQTRTISIDFAIHQPAGPATSWALNTQQRDEIEVMGHGQLKADPTKGDWYIFAADMAALPAAISVMESLEPDAKGYAFLEITTEEDKQKLAIPEGIEVRWLIHPHPEVRSSQQLEAIKGLAHMKGTPNVFVAGELGTIREIKHHIKNDVRFSGAFLYISSYWKIGLKEEEHKIAKRQTSFV